MARRQDAQNLMRRGNAMAYARDLEERGLIQRGPEDGDYVAATDIWGVG